MPWPPKIRQRQDAYRRLFLDADGKVGPDAMIVLADLKSFCNMDRSTVRVSPVTRSVDPLATMMAEGRREAYMRIQAYLQLSDRQSADLQENDE